MTAKLSEERDAAVSNLTDEEYVRGEDFELVEKLDTFKSSSESEVTELREERDAAVSSLTEMKSTYEEKISNFKEKDTLNTSSRTR